MDLVGEWAGVVPSPAPERPRSAPRVLLSAPPDALPGLVADLRGQGLAVLVAPAGGVVAQLDAGGIDLVLLHGTGDTATAELAEIRASSAVPVLVALSDSDLRRAGDQLGDLLEAGADDCVPSRVTPGELSARARALVRRTLRPAVGEVLRAGEFAMDLARHVFVVGGVVVHLPPKEFGLMELLIRRDGRVVSREEALTQVWGPTRTGDPTTVDVHVKRLRAKVEQDPAHPEHLLTVRGMGYRFAP